MHSSRDFTLTRRRLGNLGVLFLAVAATVGCREPTAVQSSPEQAVSPTAADLETEMIKIPVDFVAQLYCLDEPVHFRGEVKVHSLLMTNQGLGEPSGQWFQHAQYSEVDVWDGVGLETGDVYHYRRGYEQSIQAESPVNEYPVAYLYTSTGVVTSPGSGLVRWLQFKIAFMVNAENEVVVDQDSYTVRCLDGA